MICMVPYGFNRKSMRLSNYSANLLKNAKGNIQHWDSDQNTAYSMHCFVKICHHIIIKSWIINMGASQWHHINIWRFETPVSRLFSSPGGCGDLSVRLGSRIGPHRHRVVVEVHWRGAQGWRSISWVVATFNHVDGSFNLLMAATGDVWIIPSFRNWGYVLHVEHISCVITNYGQLQWAIPSLFSIAL